MAHIQGIAQDLIQKAGNGLGQAVTGLEGVVKELLGDFNPAPQSPGFRSAKSNYQILPQPEPQPQPQQNTEEAYGPPMPLFQNPTTQPNPTQPEQNSLFKPLGQRLWEIEEREARAEILDENNNWVQEKEQIAIDQTESKAIDETLPPKTVSGKQPTVEAETDFDKSLSIILEKEGGFSNRPPKEDPGGRTMRGITQTTYDNWRKKNKLGDGADWPEDVAQLNDSQIREFYRDEIYYNKKLDEIKDSKIRHVTFDGYTMSSPQGVAKYTSEAIKDVLPEVDLGKPENVFGPSYRKALNRISEENLTDEFLEKLADKRTAYLKTLKNQEGEFIYKHNPGWFTRVDKQRPGNPNNIFQKFDN